MFSAPELVFCGTEGVRSYFVFCVPGLIFDGTERVGSLFYVLCAETSFRWYRGRWVSFSCCVRPDSFSVVPRASGPVFMFYDHELVFGGAECVLSRFHVLRARSHFRRYRGRRVPFSCFSFPDSFYAVPRASAPVFMFCAPRLVFCKTQGVRSRFHVLCSRTRLRWCRVRRVLFSCFASPDSFSAVPKPSGPVFMCYAPRLIFGGAECVGSCFHVLALLDMFSAVPSASGLVLMFCVPKLIFGGPVFLFCAPGLVFGGTEGVSPVLMFCAPRHVFGGKEGVGSRFHVLRV
jgi:hypothetical protein